ncbi:MAG: imidazolonepropionase-like amidohydrolase [Planctomycetota bacterium]|jgi:imidazolonepropionase-like amidohydrolase
MQNQQLRTLAQTAAATCLAVTALTSSLFATPGGNDDGNIVIKAGKVITLAGDAIENGTIVIENGRVTAVGKDIKYPWNAEVKEYPHSVAFPGFVEALSNSGMDRANENIDVAAFLNVKDSLDPVSFFFEDSLRAGVTTINVQQGSGCVIGGMGYVVKPTGMTVEAMTVKPNSGIAMSAIPKQGKSRATQVLALRRAFSDLRSYLEGVVQEKKDGSDYSTREALYQGREADEETKKGRPMGGGTWTVENLDMIPRWEIDEKQAPLLGIVEGKTAVYFYCSTPGDVHTAIKIARVNGFLNRTVLSLDTACWKAADLIKEHNLPVILPSSLVHVERDPITGVETETFLPTVFQDKGIRFALRSAGSSAQSLWYQAALCVGHGMTRVQALAAVTTTPATILGLEKRVGSLATGSDGNVVIFSGDPLSVTSNVEFVVIEGNQAYDRSTDIRIRHLTTGSQPENTAPEVEPTEVHKHDDPIEEVKEELDAGENEEEENHEDDGDGHEDHEDHDHDGDGHEGHDDGEDN